MDKEKAKELLKEVLRENLSIEVKEEVDFYSKNVYIAINFDGEEITSEMISLSDD